ncbi:glycosyltransferase [Lysobacter sp. GX 14042]|uniref:glycosyltransferase n=1 Tax=Lysobacter sp. GX 14042 TaxID=2907155 RepID=UPI001F23DD18|nr:glycosyltransferase [Lysobacter sp. GX 14042]MCE7032748.1 glycosyltransferase [Lysobacter sp. GX 14042]
MSELPIVVLPVGSDDDALDATLAALEAGTAPGTRVWLADNASTGPRGAAIIERWLAATRLRADYSRRQRRIAELDHLDEVLAACGGADVAVLAADAVPLPGWLERMAACLASDGAVASVSAWSNAGEAVAWPRIGETVPPPAEPARLARAAARMPAGTPELPAAVGHAVVLRGAALQKARGLDVDSFGSWDAGLTDLSLRLAGLGWRNVLCTSAFVARPAEGLPADGDMERLAARWPDWHARLAGFLMDDPLRGARAQLSALLADTGPPHPQADLFP